MRRMARLPVGERSLRETPALFLRYRRTVRKLSYQGESASHRLNGLPQNREQNIAARLQSGNAVLCDPKRHGQPHLRRLSRPPELTQRHFFRNQFRCASLCLAAVDAWVIEKRGKAFGDSVFRGSTLDLFHDNEAVGKRAFFEFEADF